MRRVAAILFAGVAVGCIGGCTSEPDPQEVTLLAGGGSGHLDAVSGDSQSGREVALEGEISALTGRADGTIAGIIDSTSVLTVDSDGSVSQRMATSEDGTPIGLADVAIAPDGTIYVRPDYQGVRDLPGEDVAVYRLDDDNVLQPTMGAPGQYNRVTDIAVDTEGRLVVVANVGDASPGANQYQPHQIRRMEVNGIMTTLAGAAEVSDEGPSSDDYQTWLDLPDGTPARDLPLYMHTGIDVGPNGTIYLASGESIAAISADGTLTHIAGGGESSDGESPLALDEVFGAPVPGDEFAFATLSPAVGANEDGDIVSAFAVGSEAFEASEVVSWAIDNGGDSLSNIVDASWDSRPTVLVRSDGGVELASALGHAAAWLDDNTIAVVADGGTGQSIIVTVHIP